ncbi:MAG: dual specificity protein phosphatase family protein [Anaerolineales bacterium]|nr:dual specificity protein phosphatase family protein [Anaerolineales bacterium]
MDYSQITEDLFVGTTPLPGHYDELRSKGVTLVINMRWDRSPYPDAYTPPMRTLWLRTFDFALFPIPISALEKGAKAALDEIKAGGKVYAHCFGGSHRGVAMGAAVLIAQGYAAEEAMQLLKQQRAVADPDIWYIRNRILKFEQAWRAAHGK